MSHASYRDLEPMGAPASKCEVFGDLSCIVSVLFCIDTLRSVQHGVVSGRLCGQAVHEASDRARSTLPLSALARIRGNVEGLHSWEVAGKEGGPGYRETDGPAYLVTRPDIQVPTVYDGIYHPGHCISPLEYTTRVYRTGAKLLQNNHPIIARVRRRSHP